jgi:glycine hydroxymethyltransferase
MNKNMLPSDTSAINPSGIRIGSPEMTRLGMKEDEMDEVAELVHLSAVGGDDSEVRQRARLLKEQFNRIHYCWPTESSAYDAPTFSPFN